MKSVEVEEKIKQDMLYCMVHSPGSNLRECVTLDVGCSHQDGVVMLVPVWYHTIPYCGGAQPQHQEAASHQYQGQAIRKWLHRLCQSACGETESRELLIEID